MSISMSVQAMVYYTFFTSVCLYLLSIVFAGFTNRTLAEFLFAAGIICNGVSIGLRGWIYLPLLPLHQGPFFLPFFMGIIGYKFHSSQSDRFSLFIFVTFIALTAALFPNDFYLPFLQFKTVFAHGFFLLGVIGKALFLLAGVRAARMLLVNKRLNSNQQQYHTKLLGQTILWGFFFWTLSVFSGAIWAWLGWGSPVVWDDPLMTTSMATWLLYALLLHLHLTWFSSSCARAWFALGGAVFLFCFTCVPELGPFKFPGLLI
jgi:hypothetical protein